MHLPHKKHGARRKQMGEAFAWGVARLGLCFRPAPGVVFGVKDQLCLV